MKLPTVDTLLQGVQSMGKNIPIRVLIVDDQPILHNGISSILQMFEDIDVVGKAFSGEEALNISPQVDPDVILIDLIVPDRAGVEVTREIMNKYPHIKVIVITSASDPDIMQSVFDAGAIGYLLKDLAVDELVESIRAAYRGLPVLSMDVIQTIMRTNSVAKKSDPKPWEPVRTKLHRPRLTQKILHRPRLYDLLEQTIDYPLTIVSAPAGYGKSTLISAWLESGSKPHAWLTLDEHDNDLAKFNSYFLAALQTLFPEIGGNTQRSVNNFEQPNAQLLAKGLINDLDTIATDFILVMDDYNVIHDPEVHEFLSTLLQHPPRRMHLFIATRHEPSLTLPRLRARNQVNEIGVEDIRFTMGETVALINERLNLKVDHSIASHLLQKTEGWIAGLNMIMFASGNGEDLEHVSLNQGPNYHLALDYLMVEIVAKQPQAIQTFMMKISILEEFNASISDSICSPKIGGQSASMSGEEFINWLITNNMFVVPLDDEGKFYRFHNLFRQLLQRELRKQYGSDEIYLFHTRASNWYAENGEIENALRHAQAAGNIDVAAHMFANYRHELTHHGRWEQLEEILQIFPPSIIESQAELTLVRVALLYQNFQISEIPAQLERVEALLAEYGLDRSNVYQLQGEVDAYRSVLCYWAVDVQGTVKRAQAALENLPIDWFYTRALALQHLTAGFQMQGDIENARSMQADPLDQAQLNINPLYYSRLLTGSSMSQWVSADLLELRYTSSHSLALAEKHALSECLASANYFMGIVSYEENNLDGAIRHFSVLYEQRYEGPLHLVVHGLLGLSHTYQVLGQHNEARRIVDNVTEFLLEKRNRELLAITEAFRAELDLRQGNLAAAKLWAEKFTPNGLGPMPIFYHPNLTFVKVLLAIDTEASRNKAAHLLSRLQKHLKEIHNKRFLIEVLCFQALLHDTQGDEKQALVNLEQAVLLAEPGGLLRVFLDLGPKLAHLLGLLDQEGVAQAYIREIMQAFLEEKPILPTRRKQSLIEPLTNRELQILGLLAKRKTNKEIATDFVISAGTVKTHTIRIYQKLEVNSRREAVEKGVALGLIAAVNL